MEEEVVCTTGKDPGILQGGGGGPEKANAWNMEIFNSFQFNSVNIYRLFIVFL